MSEPLVKQRPTVDLDDFERRLRQNHHEDDPLAELARLVGEQSDPYQDVFAQEAVAHQGQPLHAEAHHDDPHGRQEPAFGGPLAGSFAAIEAGLRGSLPGEGQHDPYAQQPAFEPQDYTEFAEHGWAQQGAAPAPTGRNRRPLYIMAATIALGVMGVGGAFALKGHGTSPSEVKTIMAAAGPTKIQPPADTTPADQGAHDSAMLGKNQPAPTQLVSREEQPVDLAQAVKDNTAKDGAPAAQGADAASVPVPLSPGQTQDAQAGTDAAPAPGPSIADFGAGMPAPKKVKVVSVRPDGTILPNDQPPQSAMPAAGTPKSAEAPIAKTSTPKTASAKSTTRVTPKTIEAAANDTGDAAPAPAAKPAKKAKPQKVAMADTNATTDATPDSPAAKATGGGNFAVQLAAPGSESEAKSASSRLAKKFSGALGVRQLGFHKADSNGKSVYRVRVSSLSKDEATSICEKLKANGGSCFVAKN